METIMFVVVGCAVLAALPAIIEAAVGIFALAFRICTGVLSSLLSGLINASLRMNEREATLARASWGAVMCYAAAFEVEHLIPKDWQVLAFYILAMGGLVLFLVSCGWRSRGDRNGRMIAGYLIKIGLGVALLLYIELPYSWLAEPARLLAIWCLITGSVKLALVLRGNPKVDAETPDAAPVYGDARFTVINGDRK